MTTPSLLEKLAKLEAACVLDPNMLPSQRAAEWVRHKKAIHKRRRVYANHGPALLAALEARGYCSDHEGFPILDGSRCNREFCPRCRALTAMEDAVDEALEEADHA